jgi:hypothetical protein
VVSKILRGIGSFFFWSYHRGSWQYDLKVALILAFIFLTPRHVLHDPAMPVRAGQVTEVSGAEGRGYRIEAGLLQGGARGLEVNAEQVLRDALGRDVSVSRIQPVLDQDGRVQAYTVWVQDKRK